MRPHSAAHRLPPKGVERRFGGSLAPKGRAGDRAATTPPVRLSLVFYVFLARTALGTMCSLLPLSRMRAAERHIRFQCVLTFVLAMGAAALYDAAVAPTDFPGAPDAFLRLDGAMPWTLFGLGIGALLANMAFGTFKRKAGRILLGVAALAGVGVACGTAAFSWAGGDPGARAVLTLNAMLGGMVMGGINDAMILGHFYLMIRGLPLNALRRAGWFVGIVLIARMVLFGLVLLFWDGASEVLLGRELVWTTWRVAFGFFGPMVLLVMVAGTVKVKHTQAATGLLYVAVGFAIMGELAAVYLEIHTGLPV